MDFINNITLDLINNMNFDFIHNTYMGGSDYPIDDFCAWLYRIWPRW